MAQHRAEHSKGAAWRCIAGTAGTEWPMVSALQPKCVPVHFASALYLCILLVQCRSGCRTDTLGHACTLHIVHNENCTLLLLHTAQ